jgi:protein TonB
MFLEIVAASIIAASGSEATSDSAQIMLPKPKGPGHYCRHYPAAALRVRAEGYVQLSFNIGTDGKVSHEAVVTSSKNSDLDQGAISCASGFVYEPATRNGVALECPWMTIVSFCLDRQCRESATQAGKLMSAAQKLRPPCSLPEASK